MQIVPGNFSIPSSRNLVRDYWPGWDLIRVRGSALIGPVPANSWDIVDESDRPFGIQSGAGGAVPTGSVWLLTCTMRVETPLIASDSGSILKAGPNFNVGGIVAISNSSNAGFYPISQGYFPTSTPTTFGIFSTISQNIQRLWLVQSGNPLLLSTGTLRSPTARAVRIPIQMLCLRRSRAIELEDLVLSPHQQLEDQGLLIK